MAEVTSGMLDALQSAVIEDEAKKAQEKKKYKFDKLKMFFGEDFTINGIRIVQPTIGDILELGEKNFYNALSPFTNNSTSIRLMLWTAGIDWCKVGDLEVFNILMTILKQSEDDYKSTLKLIFPDIDVTQFQIAPLENTKTGEFKYCLYHPFLNMVLSEEQFTEISEYIREMLNVHPKVEKAKGKITKKWMIDEDRQKLLEKQAKDEDSDLLPLVSSLINHPGFKYNLKQLKEVGIVQFYDSIQRLQIYEGTRALLQGSYSGFCDLSKVDKNKFNFMRSLDT